MTDIMLMAEMHPVCMQGFEEMGTIHRYWEAADKEAFLAEIGPKIDIVSTFGSFPADESTYAKLPNLKLISSFGVGYDGIDVPLARRHGVAVTNTPDVLNDAVAELTVGLMIAQARRLVETDAYVRDRSWARAGAFPLTAELTGKRAGIFGLGRIGKEIARRLEAMKMEIVYHGRNEQKDQPYGYYGDLAGMAAAVDWLVVVAPGTPETTKAVNAKVLAALGPEGTLVNVGRGAVVDEEALVAALKSGAIAGAALDVFADEPRPHDDLLSMENVTLSPHQASATVRTRNAMAALVVENARAHLAGKPLLTPLES